MNTTTEIKNVIKRGDLVNLSLSSDQLNNTLIEMLQIIQSQQTEIDDLKIAVAQKLSRSDHDLFKKQMDTDFNKLARQVPNIEDSFRRYQSDINQKFEQVYTKIEESNTETMMSIEGRINVISEGVTEQIKEITDHINDLTDKIGILSNTPKETISGLPVKPQTDTIANSKKVKDIERKIIDLEGRMIGQEKLTSLKEEMSTKMMEMQSQISIELSRQASQIAMASQMLTPSRTHTPQNNHPIKSTSTEHFQATPKNVQTTPNTNLTPHISKGPIKENMDLTPPAESRVGQLAGSFYDRPIPIEAITESDEPEDFEFQLKEVIDLFTQKLEDSERSLVNKIEQKADVSLVERMFERIRIIVAAVKDETSASSMKHVDFVTHSEMEEWITKSLLSFAGAEKTSYMKDINAEVSLTVHNARPEVPKTATGRRVSRPKE